MKKFLLVLLTFIMLLSLTSCKTTCEKDGHVDGNTDGVCDVCGEMHVAHFDADNNGYCDGCKAIIVNYELPGAVGKVLKNNLEKQISKVNSVKIRVEFESSFTDERWYLDNDGQITYFLSTEIDKGAIDITVSRAGDFVNAKMEYYQTEDYNRDDGHEEYSHNEEMKATSYLIDGKVYEEIKDGLYSERELVPPQVKELLEKIASISLLSDEEKEAVIDALSTEVVTVLDLKDNKGSVSVDLKPTYDNLKNYVLELDFDNTTVGMVVTDALSHIDPELTTEKLIEAISYAGNLTVIEAYGEINAYLTENYDTTVQEIYDEIINDPDVVELISYLIIERNEYDPENEKDMSEVKEVIDMLQEFNVDEYIESSEFAEITLYEVLSGFEILPFTLPNSLEDFTGALDAISKLTISEFEEMADFDYFSTVKEIAEAIEINALSAKVDINFKNVLELDTINGIVILDMEETSRSNSVTDKFNVVRRKETVKFSIYDLSEDAIEIALPNEAGAIDETIFETTYDGIYNEEPIRVELMDARFVDEGVYAFDFCVKKNESYLYFYAVPVEVLLEDEIVVPFSYVTNVSGGIAGFDENSVFRFKLIRENFENTVEVLEFCDFREYSSLERKFFEMSSNNSANGYKLEDVMTSLNRSGNTYTLKFESGFDFESIQFELDYTEKGDKIICKIKGISVNSQHSLKHLDGRVYYGYCDDVARLNAYFDGDLTFEMYFDEETKTLSILDYPVVLEEYRDGWAE